MSNFIEVHLDDNTIVYLETIKDEIPKAEDGLFTPVASNGRVIEKTKDFLDATFNQIKTFSNEITNAISNIDVAPDEFEVEFGVKFAADAGIIISSISSEASITVKLKWIKSWGIYRIWITGVLLIF